MTINDAIKNVMKRALVPLTAKETYQAIVKSGLYIFHAQKPEYIVLGQIRRHCAGIDFPTAERIKFFKYEGNDKYSLLDSPIDTGRKRGEKQKKGEIHNDQLSLALNKIMAMKEKYLSILERKVISEIRCLEPYEFEKFCMRMLEKYGFINVNVTKRTNDGGIDGFGRLRVGLGHLNVAFQCKRWTKANIQRTEIDKFRGASQGEYEQGVFFATTSFSEGAIRASIKSGAIPIVLIDSKQIVNMMIEKEFGIEVENIKIPTYALDKIDK